MLVSTSVARRCVSFFLPMLLLMAVGFSADSGFAAVDPAAHSLAMTPPMGWNDWAHYQCRFTAQDILANAHALVKSGLAARGYNTVTIDDCWMLKDRDAAGNLQVDPQRFPHGMKPIADAVHALGLKFGIYEDAGYLTCGKFAGSGVPKGGGKDHFVEDARLFASWGVDYLKLDGCNLYVPKGGNTQSVYREAYAAESAALKSVNRPIVFSESAPAYFQDSSDWYDVLTWVREYGQLWREGTDIRIFRPNKPDAPRFPSVLWNYAYNLPLGRFQKPGNWNDSDFILGGDAGLSMAETRSQVALWSMMSAPLILSSNVEKLNAEAVTILGNKAVIGIDQDALGRMATLVRRNESMDVLFKPLSDGSYAVAVLNRSDKSIRAELRPVDFGFAANTDCRIDAQDLWSGKHDGTASSLQAQIGAQDTAIWKIHPTSSCGRPSRSGTITMITATTSEQHDIADYSRCLAASGSVEQCGGTAAEGWTVTADGALKSDGNCLAVADGKPAMQRCSVSKNQRWKYTLAGNLVNAEDNECLTTADSTAWPRSLMMHACGKNQPNQIWSLPN